MSVVRVYAVLSLSLGFAFAAACGGEEGGASDGDAGASGGASAGGSTATGGTPNSGGTGSGSGTGGVVSGTGGRDSSCPPECFVANECVAQCGDEPRNYGCCPCPAGTINVFSCGAGGGGPGEVVSCDPRSVTCRVATPECGEGMVPSVEGNCYGPCVPIASCPCGGPDECPDPDHYTCHRSAGHCDYYVN
jgi:hypothetical protein